MPQLDALTATVAALKRVDLIPDVLPDSFHPSALFSVVYPTRTESGTPSGGKEAVLATELAREDTLEEPIINFSPTVIAIESPICTEPPASVLAGSFSEEATFTLVMADPDAPSRSDPKYRQFRHWVITGLKYPPLSLEGATNLTAIKAKPSTTPYRAPGPPPGSGVHRYTFLLFEEPAGGYTIPPDAPEWGSALEERRSWNAVKFGEQYGLKLIGANYFIVRSKE
ncbi:PEBP-like protein [Pluteus cervinus]|uniref:PEBP-like protein n=1 Tax=Pluteus cervinus TaxID=181527 RepID=A0ACD3AEY1_9AGAR|nr:PEBP-like protein [Pluteus cervinus]